ncbi:methyltransferase domain-containing protein, partial [bacterium]|nr:methyltransferase domain-containing protein [bacterium]
NVTELYPANFDIEAFNPAVFSARRLPDRIHYRMVKCINCGLVRADPAVNASALDQLYAQSSFDYTEELTNLRSTYGRYLARLSRYGVRKASLLEIGCGNGFFLEEALAQGYAVVRGVEPSVAAVARANPHLRQHISCDIMRPGLFESDKFEVICMFQILDHILHPRILLEECFRILKPGGMVLCLNHNIEAFSAKLLKARSPVIDIEHTYLYAPSTMRCIFGKYGFRVREAGSAWNKYTLHYLMRLVPLPVWLKRVVLAALRKSFIGRLCISVPLGNLYLIAQKPEEKAPGIDAFNRDIADNKGYLYTTNARLSSYLANRRLSDAALAVTNFRGKRALDIGCGDGTYTLELFDRGVPASMHGVDPADEAISIAQEKIGGRKIAFAVQSAEMLPYAAKSFDLGHLRGVLHHMEKPFEGLGEALRVAQTVVVIEPNGYNPILKLLERISHYHIKHNEKSYTPATLERWVKRIGGKVYIRRYVGLVPFFCPDWLARVLKLIEPVVERLPVVNALVCAVYVFVVKGTE